MRYILLALLLLTLFSIPRPTRAFGPPIILVHGWGGNTESMKPLEDKFESGGYTVYNLQMTDNDADHNSQQICDFLRSRNLTGVTLIGHSMGGISERHCIKMRDGLSRVSFYGAIDTPQYGITSWDCFFAPRICYNSSWMVALNSGDPTPAGPYWLNLRLNTSIKPLEGACNIQLSGTYSTYEHIHLPERQEVFDYLLKMVQGFDLCAP